MPLLFSQEETENSRPYALLISPHREHEQEDIFQHYYSASASE